ncbi:MAG: ribosome biogenesis GTPase Der [Bacteroidetes bacterium]|nr:ribosome biogenesis GTPase Der [Bacteroidota bacterium]
MNKLVAIVGRPNVGKSTLFNRLIEKRKAIVDDVSGVTRDRQYDYSDWSGREFLVVDTGGYVENSEDIFEIEIKKQVEFAIHEADIILFMVDTSVGITDQDQSFAAYLRKVNKPIVIVANKTDNHARINDSFEFYKFGFGEVIPVSSINGSGTGELLDKIVELMGEQSEEKMEADSGLMRIAVIGKPNVGKSTFVNALLGRDRNIVSKIPGTTRDSIHSEYNQFGKQFILIDTAGLRKKSAVHEDIEYYSVIRAVKAIDESDICFLLIDAREGIQGQDQSIISLVERRNKGLIILINKWDLVEKDTNTAIDYDAKFRQKIAPFNDVPIITISALNKLRIMKALDQAFEVFENRKRKISTSELNRVMLEAVNEFHPPAVKGKFVRIKYVTQIGASFPFFAFFCNHPQYIKDSYKRYLENKLRDKFNFLGTPVRLSFRKK